MARPAVQVLRPAVEGGSALMDCDLLEWNPISSAGPHSALAGVLAALVFAGIVVLLQERYRDDGHTRALELMTGALLAFAFSSFVFGVVAGGQVCVKYYTHLLLASGLLGLGGMGVFAGISWLFNVYDRTAGPAGGAVRATRLAVGCAYTVAVIVTYHLKSTASSYLGDLRTSGLNDPPGWLVSVVDIYPGIALAAVAAIAAARWLSGAMTPPRWLARRRTTAADSPRGGNRRVLPAAHMSVVYVLVIAVASGMMLDQGRDSWEPSTPTTFVVTATLLSLAVPTVGVLVHLAALPPVHPTPAGSDPLDREDESSPEPQPNAGASTSPAPPVADVASDQTDN